LSAVRTWTAVRPTGNTILQVSKGFHYTWDGSQPLGSRVSSITINGAGVDPAQS
jgi:hypothetical protein